MYYSLKYIVNIDINKLHVSMHSDNPGLKMGPWPRIRGLERSNNTPAKSRPGEEGTFLYLNVNWHFNRIYLLDKL